MKFRKFADLDWNVSEIGLGCWAIGSEWGEVLETDARDVLKTSFDQGINFFDTADVYGDGRSEKFVGELIKSTSEKIYVATKSGRRLDPHTAIGFGALNKVKLDGNSIVLATAHPSKFPDAINKAINVNPNLPDRLKRVLDEKENYDIISNNLKKVKDYIMDQLR